MRNIKAIYLPSNIWQIIEELSRYLGCSRSSVVRFAVLDLAKDLSLLKSTVKRAEFDMSNSRRRGS
jgi:DNA-binding MarR family transcriptional regulator